MATHLLGIDGSDASGPSGPADQGGESGAGGGGTGGKSKSQCAGEAFLKNAVSLGLDAAGFMPGEGAVNAVIDVGLGIAGTTTSAIDGDVPGSFLGIAGIHLSALEPLSKAIPVLGMIVNGASTLSDLAKTVKDYKACVNGGG